MEEEQTKQQPIPQPETPKKKFYKKWWFWIVVVISMIIAGVIFIVLSIIPVDYNNVRGIELWSFGFGWDTSTTTTTIELSQSTCVELQGDSSSKVTNYDFKVKYGSLENTAMDELCEGGIGASLHSRVAINPFGNYFKYIAPSEMPDGGEDEIKIEISNEEGDTLKKELTIFLVEEFDE